ncbi:MAG: recombination protein O N-terminal domain-containing protein [Sphingomonadaceae bacterium]|nr:recombination protein O N-terminal domain-containing protein [Sphingomonadaceae bacterium]
MLIRAQAILCAVRAHGEHGAVVRALTRDHGLLAGYVRGGRSRRLRPVLSPGNIVAAEFRARSEEQLAALTVELVESRAALLAEPLAAAAVEWVTALAAVALPEGHPYPRIHDALAAMLDALVAAPTASGWAGGMARYERLLLAELGYGDDEAEGMLFAALRRNGERLAADLLTGRNADVLIARERLVERLRRAMLT